MSNKDALLEGAVRCLYRIGYARTTARDIVKEAGVSLAAIGYHYGSTEELLNQALIKALEIFSAEISKNLPDVPLEDGPRDRFTAVWDNIYKQFDQEPRLWAANVEVVIQAEHSSGLRDVLVNAQPEARRGLAVLFHGPEIAQDEANTVGAVYQALLFGLLTQRLINPAASLQPQALKTGLLAIAGSLRT